MHTDLLSAIGAGAGAARAVAALPRRRAHAADRVPAVPRGVRAADPARSDGDDPSRAAQGRRLPAPRPCCRCSASPCSARARRSTPCAARSKSPTRAAASRRCMPRWRSPASRPTPPRPRAPRAGSFWRRRRLRSPRTSCASSSSSALVVWRGEPILETFVHPLSGMMTFALSLPIIFWLGGPPAPRTDRAMMSTALRAGGDGPSGARVDPDHPQHLPRRRG